MFRLRWFFALVLVTLIVTACGGNGKKSAGPSGGEQPGTVEPTSVFPPTWTPVPTLTPPPRVTIEYTYEPPTAPAGEGPAVTYPTRTPVTPPPGGAPTQPVSPPAETNLTVTASMLGNALGVQFGALTSYIKGMPDISFADGLVRIEITVYTTPSDVNSARPIVIEADAAAQDGRARLTAQNVYFADDNTPYEDALAGYILGAVETGVNDMARQLYLQNYPAGGDFEVTAVTITETGITVDVAPSS
jgi:hypothetical protein